MRSHAFSWPALISLVAVPAAADNPCVALELTAPEGCPSASSIEQTVMELVHTVPPAPLSARATIARLGERFTVTLVTAAGERTFDGETCQAAADALTVILALAVDPNASTMPPVGAPGAAPAPTPAPAPPSAPAAPVAPVAPVVPVVPETKSTAPSAERPTAPEPLTLGGSLVALIDTGLLPGIGVGALGALRLNSGVVSAEFSGKFLFPRSTTLDDGSNRGGTFRWAGLGLDGCLRVLDPLHSCFGVEVGGLTGQGFGVDQRFTSTATIVALTGGAVGRLEIDGGFSLEARLGVAVPMDRPVFGLEGFGELHEPDPVTVRVGIGVAFQ